MLFANNACMLQTFAQLAIFDAKLTGVVAVARTSQILPGHSEASCTGNHIPNDSRDIYHFQSCGAEDLIGNSYSLNIWADLNNRLGSHRY